MADEPSMGAVFGTVVKVAFSIILIIVFFAVCSALTCATCVSTMPEMPESYPVE